MNPLHVMKGPERSLMTIVSGESIIRLMAYDDGSLGVRRNSELVGVWEYSEVEECLSTFLQLAPNTPELLVVYEPLRNLGSLDRLTSAVNTMN